MCLIVFAWKVMPGLPLLAAANRDEFYARPTAPATWWSDHPHIYAGRDLRAGGTWMGISRDGRFAAVTNVRERLNSEFAGPSRGELVTSYLASEATPAEHLAALRQRANDYAGFNLLLGDRETLIWFSNRSDDARNGIPLTPGVYGLSNAALNSPWPKVLNTKAELASLLLQGASQEAYFEMLADTNRAPEDRLPCTGVSLEWERVLSAVCIQSPEYGTRSSTLVTLYGDGSAHLEERILR